MQRPAATCFTRLFGAVCSIHIDRVFRLVEFHIIYEYHTQLAKMSFDKIFDLAAGVYFYFYNIRSSCFTVQLGPAMGTGIWRKSGINMENIFES